MLEKYLLPLVCERFINDMRYREGHLRVVNALPQRKVFGLHIPDIKKLAKCISAKGAIIRLPDGNEYYFDSGKDVIRCFEQLSDKLLCYEECLLWGFLINYGKFTLDERLAMLRSYVPIIDNWAVCDTFCANAKWIAKIDKESLWLFLKPYFKSKREFEVRFAVVASMCYLLCEEWLDRLFETINTISFEEIASEYRTIKGKPQKAQEGSVQGASPYYVRMGVAWLLATALASFPHQTREFVRSSSLPDDVVKLYIRKARESFRTRTIDAI